MNYIIGIDIGTTSTKAVAFTTGGDVLANAHVSYSPISSQPGYHELDTTVLLQAVIRTLKDVLEKTKAITGLSGISFSCAMHSLIAVDKDGQVLTNAITWADMRSKDVAAGIKNTDWGNRIYQYTGTPIHSMSPLCKITWLKENEPAIFSKAYKFIGIKEYIWLHFFGKYLIDYSLASATGLFDIYQFKWYDEALELAGISADHLSLPVSPTHIETGINRKYQTALGLTQDIPFIIGGSDGCLANLGSNAMRPGDASLTIGTSGALRMTSTMPKHDPKQRIFNYILTEHLFVSGGAVNNGAVVVQWFVENFMNKPLSDGKDFSAMVEEADAIVAGSGGLLFLPYLSGERAPVWDADARGVFFGISSKHTQQHFMRAVIEGISFSLYQVGVSLEETIGPINDIYASGGFIQSKFWLQLIADMFNKKVYITNTTDASAIGAAMLGFLASGLINNIEELQKILTIRQVFEPDANRHAVYQKNFLIFTSLYDKLKDEFKELRDS
jgi:gluconokinase